MIADSIRHKDIDTSALTSSTCCSIREQRRCVAVFLAGTSGTGKSTLASLLAARMGITTVLSTDSIRHMLRGFTTPEADPLLWASTYQVHFIAFLSRLYVQKIL